MSSVDVTGRPGCDTGKCENQGGEVGCNEWKMSALGGGAQSEWMAEDSEESWSFIQGDHLFCGFR